MNVILYHGDLDGIVAAAAVARYLNNGGKDWKAIEFEYGAPFVLPAATASSEFEKLWLVDCCLPRKMLEFAATRGPFEVIDHHKSTSESVGDMPGVTVDLTQSACGLAWRTLFPGETVPDLFRAVEDRDLWRFALPGTREICLALETDLREKSADDAIQFILDASRGDCSGFIERGKCILSYMESLLVCALRSRHDVELDGVVVPAVNSPVLASEICSRMLKDPNTKLCLCYHAIFDGRIRYELRSSEDGPDVSEIAARHGGGGHKRAAGFISREAVHLRIRR